MKAGSPLHVLSHLPLQLLEPVRRAHPDVVLTHVPMQGEPPDDARGEVLLTHAKGSPNLAAVVARGEVEIGFQQVSELIHTPGVTFVGAIPAELQPGFSFVGAITSAARQPDAARALLRFLASPEAAATILKAGLTLPIER